MLARLLLGYLPVQLTQALVSFGSVWVFTRLLGAEDYGRYALVLTVMALIHTASLTWSEAAAYRFHTRSEADQSLPDHVATSLALTVIAVGPALILCAIAWGIAHWQPEYRPALLFLFVLLPLNTLVTATLEMHKAAQRVRAFVGIELVRVAGGFVLGTGLALLCNLGAAAPFAGMTLASAIAAAIALPRLLGRAKGGRFQRARAQAHLAYGWPVALALLLDLALSAGDRFVIAAILGDAAVGAYAAGYGVADKTLLFLSVWAGMASVPVMMAAYDQGDTGAFRQAGLRYFRLVMLLVMPAAVGMALVARPLAEVMIGPELRATAASIIPLIALGGLFNALQLYFAEAFPMARRTGVRAALLAVPACLNIGLNVWLVPVFGLMGAVGATVFCYGLLVVLYAVIGRRFAAFPVEWRTVAEVAGCCSIMAVAVSLVPAWGGLLELFSKAAVGASVYGLCVFLLDAGKIRHLVAEMRSRAGQS